MKRCAAITGPTPQFVRWAIEKECGLRELDVSRLPVSTFQQLRGIRAISTGITEKRVHDGFCFAKPVTPETPAMQVKAIPVDEVLTLFGGDSNISAQCLNCPANAMDDANVAWAGCFGFVSADPKWSPEASSLNFEIDESLVNEFDEVIAKTNINQPDVNDGRPQDWYELWQPSPFTGRTLEQLKSILFCVGEIRSQETESAPSTKNSQSNQNQQIAHLRDAADRCYRQNMRLHIELVPPGYSDGVEWTIRSHCGNCKFATDSNRAECENCGNHCYPIAQKKCKVLGDRPYLLLHQIIGQQPTADLIRSYFDGRATD